jgi:DNA-binding FadR family transcriptional regulator
MVKPLEAIARPKLVHESAQEAIREYVLHNNLGAGDPLPGEMELARQLGISRNSVREAIRALESIGVLEVRRGRGVFVREFSFEPLLEGLAYGLLVQLREVEELLDIRCVLETGMVDRAIATLDEHALAELRATVDQMGSLAAQGKPFEDDDRRFHTLIFSGIESRTFLRLLDVFWMAYRNASRQVGVDPDPRRTWRDHVAILEALEVGDGEGARKALEAHYSGINLRLAAARQATG